MKIYGYFGLGLLLQQVAVPALAIAEEPPLASAPEAPSLNDSLRGMPRADYVSGKVLYEDGDFAGAVVKFESAYRASNDPRLLWNMAACHKALRHYAEVLRSLRIYERDAHAYLTPEDREDVERLTEAIVPLVSSISVVSNPADASLFLDGVSVGPLPLKSPLLVDIGKRQITLRKAGYKDFTQSLDVSGEEQLTVNARLEKIVTEGTLIVRAGPGDSIVVDGKALGDRNWQGKLTRGAHSLSVKNPEKHPFYAEIAIEPGRSRTVTVELEVDSGGGLPTWLWITGGVLVAGGAAASGYLVFAQPDTSTQKPVVGTIKPGTVHLP